MKGYSFFEEYRDELMLASSGNVIAVNVDEGSFVLHGGVCYKAIVPSPERGVPNSPVTMILFNAEYLGSRCRPVTELRAREIHPKLFEYLEGLA
ncbi:MAG TPA: hypothetical protein VNS52_03125 [Gemmatimonadaceae bacterium]|jgi:hypothetical protein|nr:hypothetical protein [Gemmatimonadaceae bacterium]